ncbi:FGGY-family carbohydrate kinase [Erwiniaceae bacterium BAC15a-03b]|uniref:FGGY-family carbohydrate kinase n=1 Tax=Winslowiella arboricola TaxID=2978220 RepID=A0A9J6PI55_9GAMM|nr:FGGY-family carbohydrate kinase [Winslowiella arboricola]MCU5771327.1 FGGY-family carbohydrate kinase [Winslowiella arboricola]MCU5777042.1 FGGY-family carbohydrate kinase [Winslowiella arboricola]
MSGPLILAIDEGTTNAKAIAVDGDGRVVARASQPLQIFHPQPGLAEQDPLVIWQAVRQAIGDCLAQCGGATVAAVAISNQRESIMIWQRSDGQPLTPLVSWQDRRSEALCRELQQSGQQPLISSLTGLAVDPMFPAAKVTGMLAAIADGYQRAAAGELCIGTVDSWLCWQLTAGQQFVTDYANASRTQLFNIHQAQWDDRLLGLFKVPREALPEVQPSAADHGTVQLQDIAGLAVGTPVLALIGDSHAALYAQCATRGEVIKATYGTGSSLMMSMPAAVISDGGLSTTLAWHDGQLRYAFEGNITHTGSGAAWLSRMLGVDDPQRLTEMAQRSDSNQGIYFVPALSGLGAPWWDLQARGLICGLTDAATPEVLARVALESVAFQIADVFFAMEQAGGQPLAQLCVDGSATENSWLMQFQADLLQRPLIKAPTAEVSALGAAVLAGRELGWWRESSELSALRGGSTIYPRESQAQSIRQNYQGWLAAVARCRYQV